MTDITETSKISRRGNKWVVTDSTGKKILGTHDTYKDALRQLRAIEFRKKG